MITFDTVLLEEPLLEFGDEFLSSDPKTGISRSGYFSVSNSQHRSEIHYAIIGTNSHIELTKEWISKFELPLEAEIRYEDDEVDETEDEDIHSVDIVDGEVIESFGAANEQNGEEDQPLSRSQLASIFPDEDLPIDDNIEKSTYEINKRMNPDFPGFTLKSPFKCTFVNDDSNNRSIKELTIDSILKSSHTKMDKALAITDIYIGAYKTLIEDSITKPNLCILIISSDVYKKLSSIPYGKGKYFNLRRYLKAQLIAIPNSLPVQILLEDTIRGTKKSIQDASMQGWNFSTAAYYKNGGIPWTISLKDKTTCFIGISFHRVQNVEKNLMRSSIAQAFNYEGKGIIFIGKQFEWDSDTMNTPAPHLTHEYADELVRNVLAEYKKYNKVTPSRVVIHKTTDFWDASINKDYAEAEGFRYGITSVLGEEAEVDLVTIKSSKIKLIRGKGRYPVLRGTLMKFNEKYGLLHTTGFIPYFESFPGVHMPRALEVSIYSGDSTIRKVSDEIMALTKLNFNNCSYYDSLPITIRFAQRVGEIIQYIPDGIVPPNKYYYYM